MQEIITLIVVLGAFALLVSKISQMIRLFKKPKSCSGCRSVCEGCPLDPENRRP